MSRWLVMAREPEQLTQLWNFLTKNKKLKGKENGPDFSCRWNIGQRLIYADGVLLMTGPTNLLPT